MVYKALIDFGSGFGKKYKLKVSDQSTIMIRAMLGGDFPSGEYTGFSIVIMEIV